MDRYNIKKNITSIFENNKHQQDVLTNIYKTFIPNFNQIKKIENWPQCGERMWIWISEQFVNFDKKNHPEVHNGGLWLSGGFSCNKKLEEWEVSLENCKFIME